MDKVNEVLFDYSQKSLYEEAKECGLELSLTELIERAPDRDKRLRGLQAFIDFNSQMRLLKVLDLD